MKISKKILGVGSIGALGILGWLTGVVLSSPPYLPQEKSTQSEMAQLKGDLSDYIAEKFKKERVNGTLVDIAVQSPTAASAERLEFPYILAYNEPVNGQETTSWIQATAVLEKSTDKENPQWHIVKVSTQKETVTYASAIVVTPQAEE